MAGYTKLWSDIVHSTIWREPAHVRLTWITMLAIAERNGYVGASLPGLADAARVTLEECRDAIARLAAPDPDSRTKEHEGRRIGDAPGGWMILNYVYHREREAGERRLIQTREAVRRFRARKQKGKQGVAYTPGSNPGKPMQRAEAEAEAEAEQQRAARDTWLTPYLDDYTAVTGGKLTPGKAAKYLKPIHDLYGLDLARAAWRAYLQIHRGREARYLSVSRFAETVTAYLPAAAAGPKDYREGL